MTPTPSKPAKWWNRAPDKPAGEALKALILSLDVAARDLARKDIHHPAIRVMHRAAHQLERTDPPKTAPDDEVEAKGLIQADAFLAELPDGHAPQAAAFARALLTRLRDSSPTS